MPGHFEKALQDGEACEVLMDRTLFVSFVPGSECRSVGTANLNSCTSAMVVSRHGAILAHIAPRLDNASRDDLLAGARHVTRKMDDFGTLYRQKQQFFSKGKQSWILSAKFQGKIALPDQRDIIESKFRNWGLNPIVVNYNVVWPPLPKDGKGTVFIDGRKGGFPTVFVEDKPIYGGLTNSVGSTQAGSQQGSASCPPIDPGAPLKIKPTAPQPSIAASSKTSKEPFTKYAKFHSSQTSTDKPSQSHYFISSEGIQRVVIEADISYHLPGASVKPARENETDGYLIFANVRNDDLRRVVSRLKTDTLSWAHEGGSYIGSKTYLKRWGLVDEDACDDNEDGDEMHEEEEEEEEEEEDIHEEEGIHDDDTTGE